MGIEPEVWAPVASAAAELRAVGTHCHESFDWTRDVLFEHHDVLMLVNRARAGIEPNIDGSSALRPRDWFQSFR